MKKKVSAKILKIKYYGVPILFKKFTYMIIYLNSKS